ncbi:LysR substrate-binding domain-containing protein [Photobacterium leiognathi]|uniref:LysR substrate-binding domain-containing protein n=1 Tax=Photobacterium leiognathi TaxID=553611 RepID=UPI0029829EC1|nr:LysR substrate-binding domain-containing protein [Photobacterium leiognathi]
MPSQNVLPTTIKKLEVFSYFMQHGDVSVVANKLSLNKLSIYRTLHELEDDIECKLFIKSGRKLEALESANVLYHSVVEAKNILMNGITEAKLSSGINPTQLRVGTVNSLSVDIIPWLLQNYSKRCADVELLFHSDSNENLTEKLKHNELDAIILYGDGIVEKLPNMIVQKVFDDTLSYVTGKNSTNKPKQSELPITVDYLSKQKLMALKQGFGLRRLFDEIFESSFYEPMIFSEFSSIFSLSFSLKADDYGSLLPSRLKSIEKQLELNFYPLANQKKYSIYLVFPRATERTFQMRALAAECRMYGIRE